MDLWLFSETKLRTKFDTIDFWTLKKPYSYIKIKGQNKFIMSYYEGKTVILTYNEDFSEINVKPFFPPTVDESARYFSITILSDDQDVAGSNPVIPILSPYNIRTCFFCLLCCKSKCQ